MADITVSVNGITKLLQKMNPNKASGPDSMKPVVLKNICNGIVPLLVVIFQKTLNTEQVPKDWTKACVTPIFKKGKKTDPINYRPISLTCILCKVIEHGVASILSKHVDCNKILYDLQHGFREKRSCETHLYILLKSWPGTHLKVARLILFCCTLVRHLTELITNTSCTSCTDMLSEGVLCLGSKHFWLGALRQ